MVALANVALTDTFNTWVTRTNQLVVKTNDSELALISAFGKANSANYYSYLIDANTSAAYSQANTAYNQANTGYTQANTAYNQANTGYTQANTAYNQANLVFGQANTGYSKANSANYYAYLVDANAASAFGQANLVFGISNNAYNKANTANLIASSAYDKSNTANLIASSAYNQVNTTSNVAISAYNQVNTTSNVAISAFTKANAALANATGTFSGSLTVTSNINVLSGNSTFSGSGYSIRGQTTSTSFGGIVGYSQNGAVYGILGHVNAWAFYGAGDGYFSANLYAAGNVTAYYSDRRLKKDIVEIKNSLDLIRQISGVYYKQNDVAKSYGYNSEETQIGVIAQEIQKVIPQAVAPAPFDTDIIEGIEVSRSGENYLTVLPDKIIPVLIQAIKQLDERLSAIEDKLNQ
jgi:hypothetical protein